MRLMICTLVVAIGMTTQPVVAQEKPELFTKVERVFQQREPGWKVERIDASDTTDPIKQSMVYRSKLGQALVEISIWRREVDAQDVFGGQTIAFANIGGKKKLKRRLPALGDENYIWTNPKSSAWPTIDFRKGRILVSIFAPNVAIAKKFARYVLDQIDAS